MIARLSKRMASFFARNNVIKSEDEEVYEYGLQLLLSTVFTKLIPNTFPATMLRSIPRIIFLTSLISTLTLRPKYLARLN